MALLRAGLGLLREPVAPSSGLESGLGARVLQP